MKCFPPPKMLSACPMAAGCEKSNPHVKNHSIGGGRFATCLSGLLFLECVLPWIFNHLWVQEVRQLHLGVSVLTSQLAGFLASMELKGNWQTRLPLRNLHSFVASILNSGFPGLSGLFVSNRRKFGRKA